MRRLSFLLIIGLLSTTSVQASEWTRARLFGADVRALVVHPQKPDVLYLGTSQGYLYVSRNGGQSWMNPRTGIPFPGYIVDNLLVDPKGRLWVAAWGLWGGGVIAVSSDDGATWSRRDNGLEEFSVRALAVDPNNADMLVTGGLDGVHRSRNAGKTWEKISEQVNVESLAIDPRSDDTIYVGTWRQAWRTDDGGKIWKHIEKGMVLDTDVFSIHLNPKSPDSVWIATCGWVYNSADRGDSWTRFKDGFNNRRIHDVDVDPHDDNVVYAASVAGLYCSRDAGKKFELVTDESLVINSIVLHPDRPNRIVLGTEGDGVYVSKDGGKSFTRSNDGLYNVRVAAVVPDPERRGSVYAVVYFGNAASGIYHSTDGGDEWKKINTTKLPEVLSLVVQKAADPKFLIGTEKGFFWSNDGAEWTLAEPTTNPLRVDRVVAYNSSRLFAATSEGVYTTKDGGRNWSKLAALASRTADIALGHLGTKRALYALTNAGLLVFDGQEWLKVVGAPDKGKRLAVRKAGDHEIVVIGSGSGLRGGRVSATAAWREVELAGERYAEVHQAAQEDVVVLASRYERDLLIGGGETKEWKKLGSPLEPSSIADVAVDSFDRNTLYFGTRGHGIFIYRKGGVSQKRAAVAVTSGSK